MSKIMAKTTLEIPLLVGIVVTYITYYHLFINVQTIQLVEDKK